MRKFKIAVVATLATCALAAIATAAIPALRAQGVQLSTNTATPITAAKQGVWVDNSATPRLRYDDGTNSNVVAEGNLSAKGDILGFDGTYFNRIAVGGNGTMLTADSTQTNGIKWATPLSSVACGTGLSGGTITTTGTCSIPNSGATAGSYTNANITVNALGIVTAASNGTGGTLHASYAAGAGASDSTLGLDSTRLAVILQDAASTIGTLFQIENNGVTANYLKITGGSSQEIRSGVADGAGAVGVIADTVNSFVTSGAKILSVRTGGSEKAYVDKAGQVVSLGGNGFIAPSGGGVCRPDGARCWAVDYPSTGNLAPFGAGIVPSVDANSTYPLGSSSKRWFRFYASGSALVSGDYGLSAGWGSTASVSGLTGSDDGGTFTVTSSGTGQTTNPTVTITFHDGTWTNAPNCFGRFEATTDTGITVTSAVVTETTSATTLVMTLNTNGLTITSAKTYTFRFFCQGM